jgi:hypothetical protein
VGGGAVRETRDERDETRDERRETKERDERRDERRETRRDETTERRPKALVEGDICRGYT